eukprot:m.1110166 g.1110166  ORF g.1110166 m.1110166 type:complete len:718 (+) comp24356_c0_seq11:97-2250(+)
MAEEEYKLFQPLHLAVVENDYPRIIKEANNVLEHIPGDSDALKCKLVALIKNKDFKVALEAIEKEDALKTKDFEKAYCLYCLQRLDDALEVLDNMTRGPHEDELRAQILYRMEHFAQASTQYRSLLDAGGSSTDAPGIDDDIRCERTTNWLACVAGADGDVRGSRSQSARSLLPAGEELEIYEEHYNMSCVLLCRGKYKDALASIDEALRLGEEMLVLSDESITEDEIVEELALLHVQRGVILQSLGDDSGAMDVFTRVLKHKEDVAATVSAIASVNVIALNKTHNVFDSRKKLGSVTADSVQNKFNSAQKLRIGVNHALLLMYMNQTEACKKRLSEITADFPNSDVPALIHAAVLDRTSGKGPAKEASGGSGAQSSRAQKSLVEYLATRDTTGDGTADRVRLVLAQSWLRSGDARRAVDELTAPAGGDVRHQPAVVGVVVELLLRDDHVEDAAKVLGDAVAFWSAQAETHTAGGPGGATATRNMHTLLRAAASLKLRQRKYREAADMYERILDSDRQDAVALTQLIECLAQFNVEDAERYGEQLPPLELDEEEAAAAPAFSVDILEQHGRVAAKKSTKGKGKTVAAAQAAADESPSDPAAIAAEAAAAVGAVTKPKSKRKKRPGKIPANANLNIPPDPERWIPRFERAEFKRKHRKKAGLHYQVQRGTQGSASGGSGADSSASTAKASAPVQAPPPQQQQASPTKSTKKKKGKKKK